MKSFWKKFFVLVVFQILLCLTVWFLMTGWLQYLLGTFLFIAFEGPITILLPHALLAELNDTHMVVLAILMIPIYAALIAGMIEIAKEILKRCGLKKPTLPSRLGLRVRRGSWRLRGVFGLRGHGRSRGLRGGVRYRRDPRARATLRGGERLR